ncbi:MAG: L-2-hydroxyglutarate oxidase [Flammeovirgaceae bacterium]|nr:L-2-hydroxyglutarate oxidase [Flammeovirgaceae bacterium]MBR06711.1 L-2-hydroxyglutarate oxidase [Rickettsiales bacterium]HCX21799.1 L-2-hydroxyglutarate oxidase [Cytophagales bacterium]|tara:strand:- start:1057 stop:2256 length:1200 start_codon:yes stop_codon:yes gene_type:complete
MYNVVIIGGGIVGLASALKIKEANPKLRVAVVEKEKDLAMHQTGHNSGVIHSGLYYKPGSLKAKNCVDGYNQLIRFCDEEEINYELCGKIVVATNEAQLPTLNMLYDRGVQNGLTGMKKLVRDELKSYEPYVNGVQGIFVPQTGIIDYKAVAYKYAEKIRHFNGDIFPDNKVTDIKETNGFIQVVTNRQTLTTRLVINCTGLFSDKIAKLTGVPVNYRIIPFRGEYFKIKPEKQHLVKNLIYPVPDPNFPFLGVHFTRMINGGIEAGPNAVLAYKREGYTKSDISLGDLAGSLGWKGFRKVAGKYWKTGLGEFYRSYSKNAFTKALQELLPDIQKSDLEPGGSGVRAQACDRDGGLIDDFLILESEKVINVGNAPSPAATSSLAIGDHVAGLALKRFDR